MSDNTPQDNEAIQRWIKDQLENGFSKEGIASLVEASREPARKFGEEMRRIFEYSPIPDSGTIKLPDALDPGPQYGALTGYGGEGAESVEVDEEWWQKARLAMEKQAVSRSLPLKLDPGGYLEKLAALSPLERRRLLEGQWESGEE